MHVPAKFQENTAMRFWVTVRKLNVKDRRTDRQTDRRTGGVAISPVPGPTAPAGDNKQKIVQRILRILREDKNNSNNNNNYGDIEKQLNGLVLTKWQEYCLTSVPQLPVGIKPTVDVNKNKATRSPEISRQQVQKLTPQFYLIYWL